MTQHAALNIPRIAATETTLHPVTWLIWLGSVLLTLTITRNPFYLTLIVLCIALMLIAVRPLVEAKMVPVSPLRFGIFVVLVWGPFNAATIHFGTTVLFHLPSFIPLFGGPITLEALTYGILNGVIVSAMYAAFTILNLVLPVHAIIRLIPRAFHPIAVVISIAITFVPTTLRQFQHIREAQAVRGHRLQGLRDWLPLLLPLLIGGLERALQLAEAMTARGFASEGHRAQQTGTRLAVVGGLAAILGGWLLRLLWGYQLVGIPLMLGGTALVLAALWHVGRGIPRTTYRRRRWTALDSLVVGCAAGVAVVFLRLIPGLDSTSLFFYPYPTLTWPTFEPVIGAAILGLLGPLIILYHR